jgi:hypothetical protein
MNKKAVSWVIIGIVIIAVVVIGVVAYWALTSTGGEGEEEEKPDVAGATSIGFKVDATIGGVSETYAFTAKNLGTSDIQLRTDETDAQGTQFIYVYNQTAQTVWASIAGEWMDVSSDFTSYWDGDYGTLVGHAALDSYMTTLADWTGTGDYEYTSGDDSYRIYDIVLNPTVEDSLFEHG